MKRVIERGPSTEKRVDSMHTTRTTSCMRCAAKVLNELTISPAAEQSKTYMEGVPTHDWRSYRLKGMYWV